jgi:hypothetical protein
MNLTFYLHKKSAMTVWGNTFSYYYVIKFFDAEKDFHILILPTGIKMYNCATTVCFISIL